MVMNYHEPFYEKLLLNNKILKTKKEGENETY